MSSWRGAAQRQQGGGGATEGPAEKRFSKSAFGAGPRGSKGTDAPVSESKSAFSSSPRPVKGGGSKFGGRTEGARPAGRSEAPAAFQTRAPVGGQGPSTRQFETSSAFGGSRRSGDDAPQPSNTGSGRDFGRGEAFGSKATSGDSSSAFGGRGRRDEASTGGTFGGRSRRDEPASGSAFGERVRRDEPSSSGSAFGGRPKSDAGGLFGRRSGSQQESEAPGTGGGRFSRRPAESSGPSAFGSSRPSPFGSQGGSARTGMDESGAFGRRKPLEGNASAVFSSSRPGRRDQDSSNAAFSSGGPRFGGPGAGSAGSGLHSGVPEEEVEEVKQVAVPKALQNAQKQAGILMDVQKGASADKALLDQAALLSPSVALSTLKSSIEGLLRDLTSCIDVDGTVRQVVDAVYNSGMMEFRSEIVRMAARYAAEAESASTRVRAALLMRVMLQGASEEERAAARRAGRKTKKGKKGGKSVGASADRVLTEEQMQPLVNLAQFCTGIEAVAAELHDGAGAATGAGEAISGAEQKLHLGETLAILVQDEVLDRRGVPSEGLRELLTMAGVRGVVDPATAAASGITSVTADGIANDIIQAEARGQEALEGLKSRLVECESAGFVFEAAEIAGALMLSAAKAALSRGDLTVKAPWLGGDAFGPMFEELLWEKPGSASAALHALQGVLNEADFPPSVLEGTMLVLYREEIVEDKDFLAWAQDTENETPGKSRALAQLPRFLRLVRDDMEEEEEEEEDAEGEEGEGEGDDEEEGED